MERKAFRMYCTYYVGVGLMVSIIILGVKAAFNTYQYDRMTSAEKVLRSFNLSYTDNRLLFTVLDNVICLLIPTVFVWKYSLFTKTFKIYYLTVVLFCFVA